MTVEVERIQWNERTLPEAWAGELRVNLLRLLAIVLFYGRHLIELMTSEASSPIRGKYHLTVTALAIAWSFEAVVLHAWLLRRRYAPWIKYFSVLYDAIMISMLCIVAGGPRTPLVLLYFALLASVPLRLSIRLVYTGTAACVLGYLLVLGHYAWYTIGFGKYYASPALRIPRSQEAIVVLSIIVCGLFAGQTVRQFRRATCGYVLATGNQEAP
jgi:hypothetical protein